MVVDKRNLPVWIKWLAQDESGCWWGFECEPNEGDCYWYENEVGRYLKLADGEKNPAWRESLQRR